MAADFRSAEFVSAAALTLFVRNNTPGINITAIVGLPSGTFQVFGTIDIATMVTTGLTLGAQGYKITGT